MWGQTGRQVRFGSWQSSPGGLFVEDRHVNIYDVYVHYQEYNIYIFKDSSIHIYDNFSFSTYPMIFNVMKTNKQNKQYIQYSLYYYCC